MAPKGALTVLNGALYGTGPAGMGCHKHWSGCGTVFEFDAETNGTRVIHDFTGGVPQQGTVDGANPLAGLVAVNGVLYGTTTFGGAVGNRNCAIGCGVVFELYRPRRRPSQCRSYGPQRRVYGTTKEGGKASCDVNGCGTVFALTL